MTKKSQFPLLAEFRLSILAGLAVLALTLFACSGDNDDDTGTSSTPSSNSVGDDPSSSSDTPISSSGVPSTRDVSPDDITFDNILYWVGDCNGSNCNSRAMFIVQWNDELDDDGLVWGYEWDSTETKYGIDMIKAIAKKDPRFFALLYKTASVDTSNGDSLGIAVGGFGYDLNENGIFKLFLNDSVNNNTIITPNSKGLFITNSYNFDDYTKFDPEDHWQSGWLTKGYWSYWATSDSTGAEWALSPVGASTRELKNGSVDAWYFDTDSSTFDCYDEDATCDGRYGFFGDLNPVEPPEL